MPSASFARLTCRALLYSRFLIVRMTQESAGRQQYNDQQGAQAEARYVTSTLFGIHGHNYIKGGHLMNGHIPSTAAAPMDTPVSANNPIAR